MEQEAERRDIPVADIMGPAMSSFARILGRRPPGTGRVRRLDEDYFRRIAAVGSRLSMMIARSRGF